MERGEGQVLADDRGWKLTGHDCSAAKSGAGEGGRWGSAEEGNAGVERRVRGRMVAPAVTP